MVLFTEGAGLNKDMLEGGIGRLAEQGFASVAPDIFHGDTFDDSQQEARLAKIKSIVDKVAMQEGRIAAEFLKARPEVDGDRLGCIGFCMGGRLAYLALAELGDVMKAAVAFYGGGIAPDVDMVGRANVVDCAKDMKGALMLAYGVEDHGILPKEHARIVQALSEAGVRFDFHLFPGAGHAFLSECRHSYAPKAAAEAWPITFAFLKTHLGA